MSGAKTLVADLTAARALIDTPEKWTKGAMRRNSKGELCVRSEAVCYCVYGAICEFPNHNALGDALDDESPKYGFIRFNDEPTTTHADIMALFDRAIAKASPPLEVKP